MADYEGVLVDLKSRQSLLDRERTELDSAINALERLVRVNARVVSSTHREGYGVPSPQTRSPE